MAIGVRLSGPKEVLGMWIGGNESAKYWLGVLNEIKNRGIEDIMIVSVDGLIGFVDTDELEETWGKKYAAYLKIINRF